MYCRQALEERQQDAPNAPSALSYIPRHALPDVFKAYCLWLVHASGLGSDVTSLYSDTTCLSRTPSAKAAQQFHSLLAVAPDLPTAIYSHAQAQGLSQPGLAAWRRIVRIAVLDEGLLEELATAFQSSLPCSAKRVLRF